MEFDYIAFESFGRLHVVTGVDFKQRVIIYSGSLLLSRALSIHYLSAEPIPHARRHYSPTRKKIIAILQG